MLCRPVGDWGILEVLQDSSLSTEKCPKLVFRGPWGAPAVLVGHEHPASGFPAFLGELWPPALAPDLQPESGSLWGALTPS